MLKITQLKIDVKKLPWTKAGENGFCDQSKEMNLLKREIVKMLRVPDEALKKIQILKKSIDARKKDDIKYIYAVSVEVSQEEAVLKKLKNPNVVPYAVEPYSFTPCGAKKLAHPPIIVGSGPAGLFCGLQLAQAGFQPIVLERGYDVDKRVKAVEDYWKTGKLDSNCNVQYGEGGAGTFSDGKLNTAIKDPSGKIRKVLQTFVEYGAPEEIAYWNKPHIGTDQLRQVVKNMRNQIHSLGGKVCFNSKMTDIIIENGKVAGVVVNEKEKIPCEVLVLALGHSARDTFQTLLHNKLEITPKAFAIGLRAEHPQDMISRAQYGESYKILPPADYKLTHQAANGRGVYSFCMCPGGFVVNSSSEEQALVVNGMSNYQRDETNANSALIVTVTPEDFTDIKTPNSVLAGVEFQRKWEKLAYELCGGKVPVQLLKDFRENRKSDKIGGITPNIKGEYSFGNLRDCLPEYISQAILEGIEAFDKKIKGYYDEDVVLSGVETRTSSPIRIVRNDHLESNITGIYPCGEGAGYAGGITSAAIDGIKVYEAIANQYCI
ncbi:NAD(P)/FAD-dependent oxidoreductase [Anaeromicropila populeti]|uniref:Uncharacterized protein n=1 Tax=Anaeromicropila populeti TaxID=37658 RepID=A0A1I6KYK5_9FIRM|nr:FAD-dependent oxidoreductase [Anaeromicropila populeti]SFR96291.1 hypothetical protein SAMN05661086_02912 [Anaeromicropila populeti]